MKDRKAGSVDRICDQWWSYKKDDIIDSANGTQDTSGTLIQYL